MNSIVNAIYSSRFYSLLPHIQIQIISAIFLSILEVTYFRRRKIPVLTSKIFSFLMTASILYIISDFFLVFTKLFPNNYSQFCVNLIQTLFAFSIVSIMMLIYLYISVYNSEEQKLNFFRSVLAIGLYAITILLFIISSIVLIYKGDVDLEDLPIKNSIFLILVIYSVVIIANATIHVTKRKNLVARRKQIFILWTMFFWIITLIAQILLPNNIISSIGITAMILIMYLGLETPDEYVDRESEALNSLALKLVLQQKINRKKEFFIINLDIEELNAVEKQYGEEIKSQLSVKITNFLSGKFHTDIYHAKPHSFTFIVPYNNLVKKTCLVDKILSEMNERMEKPWNVDEHNIKLDCHCDFLFYPNDVPKGMQAKELIEFTDEWHTYSEETGFVRRVNTQLIENKQRQETILKIVRQAIERNEIEMYFQPIYNIKEKKFTNSEALVRLKDKTTIGFISPEEFIPLAEKNGLIMTLSNRIFNQVFDFMSKNNLSEKGVKHVEVNLSALQSVDADLPDLIMNLLKNNNLKPEWVNLEITESMAVTAGHMLQQNIASLKEIGCTFSMDDFGTGYSNLSQMAKIDYELIKIDKSLLWPCFDQKNPDRENAIIILENMITMILKLGKQIVVEGVETEEQFKYLEKLGVTYIQGYYFSKPLNQSDYIKFLEEHN